MNTSSKYVVHANYRIRKQNEQIINCKHFFLKHFLGFGKSNIYCLFSRLVFENVYG